MKKNKPSTLHNHLFICGCARSGTTAIRRLLNSHNQIVIGNEQYFDKVSAGQSLTVKDFQKKHFIQNLPDFYKQYTPSITKRYDNACYVGDKIPKLYENFGQLHEEFKNVKIIFLVRDILDVAKSFKKRVIKAEHWPQQRGIFSAISEWNRSLNNVQNWINILDIHVLDYESFFYDHLGFDELLNFLNLQPTNKMTSVRKEMLDTTINLQSSAIDSLSASEKKFIYMRADWKSYSQTLKNQKILNGNYHYKRDFLDNGFDYDYENLPGTLRLIRSSGIPGVNEAEKYITFCGEAFTFGRYCEKSYCETATSKLGLKHMNLAHPCSDPSQMLNNPMLLNHINNSAIAIFELLPAWHLENDYLMPLDNIKYTVIAKGKQNNLQPTSVNDFYDQLQINNGIETVLNSITQSRNTWVRNMKAILKKVTAPVILYWIKYPINSKPIIEGKRLQYPQLVELSDILELKPFYDQLVTIEFDDFLEYKNNKPKLSYDNPASRQQFYNQAADKIAPTIQELLDKNHH